MKNSILVLLILASLSAFSQDSEYEVSSYLLEGIKAPNTHYLGEAWLNRIIHDDIELGYNITKATFKANSTLDWHKHSSAQVLIIVDGEAYYQERGKKPIVLREGDIIKCEKDTEHWHSSSKHNDVTYLAMYGGDQPTIWTEVLTQEYYDSVAESLNSDKIMIRLSEIEIHPEHLDEYLNILKEEAEASVRLESGVISIYPIYQQEKPNEIRILEIYADKKAYQEHLKTSHFQHYKTNTLHMVKSLKLVDMNEIDERIMPMIFKKN
jgi:quercetin dioxygenase-like cupin family protein/quinol monooxygenase YgiN